MRARVRGDFGWWLGALAGVVVMSWLTLQGFAWNDYDAEAANAYAALVAGDVHGFLVQLPAYGGSLVMRAPLAAATGALGGGELAVYRAVSIPGLLAVALLGLALVRRMTDDGRSVGARALVLGLCVANPLTIRALEIGHPEELLCIALAIGALLAAIDGRTAPAAIMLGLAIAAKPWAVLAIGPVLLALPARRIAALALAGAVTLALLAPIALADGARATALARTAASTGDVIFQPWQAWWFLGESGHVVIGGDGLPKPDGYRVPPGWLGSITHPLIALLGIPLSLAWARAQRTGAGLVGRAGRRGDRHDPHPVEAARRVDRRQLLLLLALALLLRCILDPWNVIYYELPFVLALLAWEALARPDRPPVLALAASAVVWATFQVAPDVLSPDLQCAAFLAWALPLAAWIGRTALRPAPARAVRPARAGRGAPSLALE